MNQAQQRLFSLTVELWGCPLQGLQAPPHPRVSKGCLPGSHLPPAGGWGLYSPFDTLCKIFCSLPYQSGECGKCQDALFPKCVKLLKSEDTIPTWEYGCTTKVTKGGKLHHSLNLHPKQYAVRVSLNNFRWQTATP